MSCVPNWRSERKKQKPANNSWIHFVKQIVGKLNELSFMQNADKRVFNPLILGFINRPWES